jgi:hypothetical protein
VPFPLGTSAATYQSYCLKNSLSLYGPVTDFIFFAVAIGSAHVVIHHPEAVAQIAVHKCCSQDGRNLFLGYPVSNAGWNRKQ